MNHVAYLWAAPEAEHPEERALAAQRIAERILTGRVRLPQGFEIFYGNLADSKEAAWELHRALANSPEPEEGRSIHPLIHWTQELISNQSVEAAAYVAHRDIVTILAEKRMNRPRVIKAGELVSLVQEADTRAPNWRVHI